MEYNIQTTHWNKNKSALSEIRHKVFIEEQNVPEELEWDEFDDDCIHILATENSIPIACGRLKTDGHIGRMAVLEAYRKKGVGSSILEGLLNTAKNLSLTEVYLHAQLTAIPFYEKFGFETCSEEFMDANIPHKTMKKTLNN